MYLKRRLVLVPLFALFTLSCSFSLLHADDDHDEEGEEHERHSHVKGKNNLDGKQRTKADSPKMSKEIAVPPGPASFKEECASCHMLYPPGLLPQRSWEKMMAGLGDHFGADASLEPKTKDELTLYLKLNSADNSTAKRAKRIRDSIPAKEVPLRFSETTYFVRKHDEISDKIYKRKAIGSRANCAACHPEAEQGIYSEHRVKIPK